MNWNTFISLHYSLNHCNPFAIDTFAAENALTLISGASKIQMLYLNGHSIENLNEMRFHVYIF